MPRRARRGSDCAGTFHLYINGGRINGRCIAREFFRNGSYCVGQVVGFERRRTQPLHCVTTFRNRLSCLIECAVQSLLGFSWSVREVYSGRLEAEQKALKTLQQSVMQFARNACALAHSRLHGHVELVRELTDTKSISRPEQEQEKNQNG